MEQAFAADDYEDETATTFGGLLAGALTPGPAAPGCAAGIYLYIRHRRRQQSDRPDFSQPA